MEAAAVHPCLPGRNMAELIEDAAHDLVGPALTTEHFELGHHPIERDLDAGDGAAGIALALAVELVMTALEFLAVELGDQGHTKQGVHVDVGVSEGHFPL